MHPTNKPKLTLLGRPDCHLCEEFEDELRAHPRAQFFEIRHADVDGRADWRERFGQRIPVLLNERGEMICETRFDADAFDRPLA